MAKKKTKNDDFDFQTIKTFEDACKKIGIDQSLPQVQNDEFAKPIIAAYKLMVIYKAINNGWVPDYNNYDQYKYYPWFMVLSSGFGFSDTTYDYDDTVAGVGSRLCTDTKEKALYIANQFEPEYNDFFLYSK